MSTRVRQLVLATALVSGFGSAQRPPEIPIRTLAPVAAKTSITFVRVDGVRQLPHGKLLVNDARARRVFVFDSTLRAYDVVLDSVPGAANSYPRASPGLIPYLADSTLVFDLDTRTLTLIEPGGTLGRTVAAPNPATAVNLINSETGRANVDQLGRLVYRGSGPTPRMQMPGGPPVPPATGPDSVPILRADFNTRAVDTLAWMRIVLGGSPLIFSTDSRTAKTTARSVRNPVQQPFDDMVVLANGSIAIVRAQDYHIDWIFPDDSRRSTARMPYDWRRLTDLEKQAKIDSAKRITDSVNAAAPRRGPLLTWPSSTGKLDTIVPTIEFVSVKDVPDYVPAFRVGAVKADADGNLWILPTTSSHAKGGLLYDVINQKGEIFERVQLPADCDVAGFGRGGVVYLTLRDGQRYYIEKTYIQR
jgi:hypothetical protein